MKTYVTYHPKKTDTYGRIILFFANVFNSTYINNKLIIDRFASKGYLVVGPDYMEGDSASQHLGNEDTKYFAVGYRIGAPDALNLCATDWVAAGAFAHPSFLNEGHFEKVKKPLLLSCAKEDFTFPTESRRKAEDILAGIKADYHVQVFAKVFHGFAVRCDLDAPHEKWAKEQSAASIIKWFDIYSQ